MPDLSRRDRRLLLAFVLWLKGENPFTIAEINRRGLYFPTEATAREIVDSYEASE